MSRPYENDVSFSMKTLSRVEKFENATVSASCGRVEFTENANFWKRIRVDGAWSGRGVPFYSAGPPKARVPLKRRHVELVPAVLQSISLQGGHLTEVDSQSWSVFPYILIVRGLGELV